MTTSGRTGQQLENQRRDLRETGKLRICFLEKLSEWNVATDTVLALQTEWKHAGTIPIKERNRLYKRYRAACDAFFERKRQYFQEIQTLQNKNLAKKIELCEKVEALKDSTGLGYDHEENHRVPKRWKNNRPRIQKSIQQDMEPFPVCL